LRPRPSKFRDFPEPLIKNFPDLRVEEEWDRLDQEVTDNAISEWCKRLTACIAVGGGHFEHSL